MARSGKPSDARRSLPDLFANGLLFLGLAIGVIVLVCATGIVLFFMFFLPGEYQVVFAARLSPF